MSEEWKSVHTLTGSLADELKLSNIQPYYEISKFGQGRNSISKKILSLEKSKDGYRRLAMRVLNGKTKTSTRKIHIHKLIALAFLGNPTDIKMQVDHIDRDRSNNNISNLHWLSASENCHNRSSHGRQSKDGFFWFDNEKIYYSESDFKYSTTKSFTEYKYKSYKERLDIEDSLIFKDEKWKKLKVNDLEFNVSDKGRVFLDYYKKKTFGTICDSNYMNLSMNSKTFRVHRLIAFAFLKKELDDLCERTGLKKSQVVVNHIDNYGLNNNVSNLEWTTVSENLIHAIKVGARKTISIIREDKETKETKEYPSIKSAVEELGKEDKVKSRKALESCLKANKTVKTHFSQGYIWYYKI